MKANLATAINELDQVRAVAKLLDDMPLALREACGELMRAQIAIEALEVKMTTVTSRVPVFA